MFHWITKTKIFDRLIYGLPKTAPTYIDSLVQITCKYIRKSYRVLENKRETFTFPIDLMELIFNYLFGIRYVKFLMERHTYTRIAERIQNLKLWRAPLLLLLPANPLLITIPCPPVLWEEWKTTGLGWIRKEKKIAYIRKLQVEFIWPADI